MTMNPAMPAVPAAAHSPAEINIRWSEAYHAGDVAAMVRMYEPDAVIVPGPGAAPVSGTHAIETSLQWLVGLRGQISYDERYWIEHGDLALGSIEFHLADGTDENGNRVELSGTTAEVARRQADGTWRYVFDHPFGAGSAKR